MKRKIDEKKDINIYLYDVDPCIIATSTQSVPESSKQILIKCPKKKYFKSIKSNLQKVLTRTKYFKNIISFSLREFLKSEQNSTLERL